MIIKPDDILNLQQKVIIAKNNFCRELGLNECGVFNFTTHTITRSNNNELITTYKKCIKTQSNRIIKQFANELYGTTHNLNTKSHKSTRKYKPIKTLVRLNSKRMPT